MSSGNPLATADGTATVLHAVASLSWPVLVLVALFVLRRPLSSALGRVSEVDVGTTKVVLQTQADTAANTTKAVVAAGQAIPAAPKIMADISAKASKDPAGAVLDAWNVVEDASRTTGAATSGVSSPSVPEVVNWLASHGADSALVPVSKSLEALRAVAARHGASITPATAKSFVAAAADLVSLLDAAGVSGAPHDSVGADNRRQEKVS